MMSKSNVALHESQWQRIKSTNLSTGQMLDHILAQYDSHEAIIAAIVRHLDNPVTDETQIRRSTVYMRPDRINALRDFISKTYLQSDGVLRILIDDYFANRTEP